MWSVRRESSRSEVAEWEEPRHPGPAVPWGSYPTLSHSATQLSSVVPQNLSVVRSRTLFPWKYAGLRGGWGEDPNGEERAGRIAGDRVAPRIAVRWWSPYPRRMPRLRTITLPCLLLIALALAACGGGGGAADADPAKAVPAGTAIYFEGVVRPEGDQKDDVLDAAGKVLRTDDPEAKIRELLDKAFKDSENPDTSYEKDIEPWLGQKAGVWVSGVDREGSRLRGGRRDEGHREGPEGDRRGHQGRGRRDQGALLRGRRLPGGQGRRGGRHRRRLLHRRHRAGVQAHGQGQRRRLARGRQEVQGHGRRDRRRPARPLLHRPQAVLRAGDQGRSQRGAVVPAAALGVPDRQARADGRRAAGRRRPDRVRHGHERPGRGRAARRSPPSSAPARRRWWPSCPATRGPRTGRRTSARG